LAYKGGPLPKRGSALRGLTARATFRRAAGIKKTVPIPSRGGPMSIGKGGTRKKGRPFFLRGRRKLEKLLGRISKWWERRFWKVKLKKHAPGPSGGGERGWGVFLHCCGGKRKPTTCRGKKGVLSREVPYKLGGKKEKSHQGKA